MDFDYVNYISSEHAELRYAERVENCTRKVAEEHILTAISEGKVLIDIGEHRYIRYNDLFFPCIKLDNLTYKVKSVLNWEMVEHRLQNAVDIYVTDLI